MIIHSRNELNVSIATTRGYMYFWLGLLRHYLEMNTFSELLVLDSWNTIFIRVSAHAWSLEIDGPKNRGGRLHRQAICMYNAYT